MYTEEINQIIKNNFGKKTLRQIIDILPIKPKTYTGFRSHCQRMGLYRDRTKETLANKNTYNYDFWEKPNLINSWTAGFIASDGCIFAHKNSNKMRFSLKLSVKDECIVDKFKELLQFKGPKRYYFVKSPHSDNISKLVEIALCSFNKSAKDLEKHFNLTPNKTKRLGPTNLDNLMLNWSFLVGGIDGDGTVSCNGKGMIYLAYCSSSPHIIKWIKLLCDEHFPPYLCSLTGRIAEVGYHNQDHFYRYTIAGLRAAIIIDYLRQFPVPRLSRKWDNPQVLEKISEYKQQYPHLFRTLDQEKLKELS